MKSWKFKMPCQRRGHYRNDGFLNAGSFLSSNYSSLHTFFSISMEFGFSSSRTYSNTLHEVPEEYFCEVG